MRIVLVNLPWKKGNRWGVRAGSRWPHIKDQTEENYLSFPFYLAYAAALLKRYNFDVHIIDAIAERISYASFYKKIVSLQPDLLVAETSTVTLGHDLRSLSHFEKLFPIALCGPDVHISQIEFLEKAKHIDFVLFGEYEASLLELAQKLKTKDALRQVEGIIHRENGNIIRNAPRELIRSLDWLPWPLRESLPMKKYNDSPGDIPLPCASMWASRGCPFKCSFCLWPQVMYGGNSYRIRNVKNVVDEMEYLVKKLGFKSIYFDDDTWNIGRQRILEFCRELEQRKLKIPWAIMARAELMDEEVLEQMRRSGLFAVKYGIESSSQQILDRIDKKLDLKKAEEMIKYTKYLGIRTHLTFTFGLPGETKQTISETINYALELNPTSVQFSLATPFPGTKFYEQMDKRGYILTKDLEKFDGNHSSVIRTENLSAQDLEKAKKRAYAQWSKHYQLKRKKLFIRQKSLKEKLFSSLKNNGIALTVLKIIRYIIRKIYLIPWRLKSLFDKNLWIVEEVISYGNIKIKLGEGQVRVYWKDLEISKGVGITTSFYYGERWFDSSQANWKLEKEAADKIVVKLKWDEVPVRQKWDVQIKNDNTICWVSKMEIENCVQLLECKAGIMLQDGYNIWKDDLGVGEFPDLTQWEEIELYNSNSMTIGAMHEGYNSLPELKLYLKGTLESNTYPQIQNTDKKIKARLLQMRRLKIEQLSPGDYDYFDLEIKIKEKVLTDQSISSYKQRVPLKFIKHEMAVRGVFSVLPKMIKYLHPKKLTNYYLDIIGILDGSYAYKGPFCVQIDLTNDCNNDCIGCWCNSPLLKDKRIKENIKKQTLPLAIVKKTVDHLQNMGTEEIYFAGGGEPFMHPDILEIIEHVKSKGMRCYINTNFTLVTEDIVKRLVELEVDNLVVSVWAGTAKTYFATHPNKSEAMFYQIKGMLKLLNSLKKKVPKVNIYNVISNLNYTELPQMLNFALDTNSDSLEFTVIDTIPDATDKLILNDQQRQDVLKSCEIISARLESGLDPKVKVLQFDQFLRRVSNNDASIAEYDKGILTELPCYVGWLFARIVADGNVNFCLKAHRIPVGNIYAQDFSHIWNSRKQQEFRRRALCSVKDDVFFSFIGNDPDSRVGCFKTCDDLARNLNMHKKIQSLTLIELKCLKLILLFKKIQMYFRQRNISQAIKNQIEKKKIVAQNILEKDRLRIVVHQEGIKLYWDNNELTESVGFNTSVCIFGLWYDSSKAKWNIVKHTHEELIIKNEWHRIPIIQQWHLKLINEKEIIWQVNFGVDSKIEIEEFKMSIMLSPAYRKWNTGEERGKFPTAVAWEEVELKNLNTQVITAENAKFKGCHLPAVRFDFSKNKESFVPQIQNSDRAINARIISARFNISNGAKVFLPGEYSDFFAKLIIGAEDE